MTGTPRRDDGFTLVELLVVMSLSMIIGTIVVSSVVRSMQASVAATARIEALNNLEVGMERISRQIRAADPIMSATDDSITVTTYDDTSRAIYAYALTPDRTQLDVTVTRFADFTSTTPVSTGTTPLLFDLDPTAAAPFVYTDAAGTTWPTDGSQPAADIVAVRFGFTRLLPRDGGTVDLTSSVYLRNTLG